MDFKQKEQFIRGLIYFIAGVIGLLLSFLIQYDDILFLVVNLAISFFSLLAGTIFITFSLAGKVRKSTKYPQYSRKVFIIIILLCSVFGTLSLVVSLLIILIFYPIIVGLLISICLFGFIGYSIWYYYNQDKIDTSQLTEKKQS